ncbi:E3 ubiquitin-protein ligase RHA2A-like [Prosopis cineraria]|uniref:E3 ubiquitin-protein ligase RHA2A-like n=1 Tax=Prosopis cineraria TaxID=364024 RepID=UPI00240FD45A|nr:E3 ubiquitin-protein ligase RHA2A-like [Prosopis cineraria]
MGLQNHLHDVSSDSIPLLLLLHLAAGFNYLRSILLAFLHSLGFDRFHAHRPPIVDDALLATVGSGFASLVVLSDQLHANYDVPDDDHEIAASSMCVVCRSKYKEGDQVRRLPCHHAFHRRCFDAWLHQLKFNCPLCRSTLVSDERVALTERRVGSQVLSWFSLE